VTTDNNKMKGIQDALEVAARQVLAGIEPSELGRGPISQETFLAAYMLFKSSRRLEKLTRWLIALTVVLAVLTGVLVLDAVKRFLCS